VEQELLQQKEESMRNSEKEFLKAASALKVEPLDLSKII